MVSPPVIIARAVAASVMFKFPVPCTPVGAALCGGEIIGMRRIVFTFRASRERQDQRGNGKKFKHGRIARKNHDAVNVGDVAAAYACTARKRLSY